jgi:hypothetical protein
MSGVVEFETGRVKALRAASLGSASHDAIQAGIWFSAVILRPSEARTSSALDEVGGFDHGSFEALRGNEKAVLP